MVLKENEILTRELLAEFFEVTSKTITNSRDKYLEELSEYCDYELNITPTGKFKNVIIKKVWCDTYYKSYKKDFIKWLENNDVFDLTAEGGYSNLTVVTNYYCSKKKIPYDGPHYVYQEFEGHTDDGKRKLKESKKVPNPDFKIWHYLYKLARRFYEGKGESKIKDYIDMRTGELQPIYLKIMTEEDKKKYDEIAFKIFGNQVSNFADTVEAIEEMDIKDMSAAEMRIEILSLRSMKDMTDKSKREAFIKALLDADLIKKKGYKRS